MPIEKFKLSISSQSEKVRTKSLSEHSETSICNSPSIPTMKNVNRCNSTQKPSEINKSANVTKLKARKGRSQRKSNGWMVNAAGSSRLHRCRYACLAFSYFIACSNRHQRQTNCFADNDSMWRYVFAVWKSMDDQQLKPFFDRARNEYRRHVLMDETIADVDCSPGVQQQQQQKPQQPQILQQPIEMQQRKRNSSRNL